MFAFTLKAALRVGVASLAYLFVMGFTFCEGFDPTQCSCLVQTTRYHFPPPIFRPGVQKLYWKFGYKDECLYKNLIILILPPQSCQKNKL